MKKKSQNTVSMFENNIHIELEGYLREPSVDVQSDPMQWWNSRTTIYPNLSLTAKQYLCIPATSVPSERVFSTAGNIVNKKRTSLSPENVDMLLFLNKNYSI
ncbi:unnamed protein product, partial [Meganyctiphanes norvegica]